MSPNCLVTTLMVAPLLAAQSLATFVTAAVRSESVQITIVGPALWDATADVAATAATAATMPISAHMRLSELNIQSPSVLGDTTGRLGAGASFAGQCRADFERWGTRELRISIRRRYGIMQVKYSHMQPSGPFATLGLWPPPA